MIGSSIGVKMIRIGMFLMNRLRIRIKMMINSRVIVGLLEMLLRILSIDVLKLV